MVPEREKNGLTDRSCAYRLAQIMTRLNRFWRVEVLDLELSDNFNPDLVELQKQLIE